MYRVLPHDEPVSQGDIFDDCPIFGLDADDEGLDVASDPVRWLSDLLPRRGHHEPPGAASVLRCLRNHVLKGGASDFV